MGRGGYPFSLVYFSSPPFKTVRYRWLFPIVFNTYYGATWLSLKSLLRVSKDVLSVFSYLVQLTMNAFSSSIFSHWCTKEKFKTTKFYKLKCAYYTYSVERYFEFFTDKRLRSYSSNKLKINTSLQNYSKALFSIDYHIYGTTCLINSGPLI